MKSFLLYNLINIDYLLIKQLFTKVKNLTGDCGLFSFLFYCKNKVQDGF